MSRSLLGGELIFPQLESMSRERTVAKNTGGALNTDQHFLTMCVHENMC